ncbi:PC-Esterase [Corchorus olitorius]|uniref:PC-Esterase n=1 Tax=Corchorus olitorius TaxID=93759 RepID=A0A1R3GLW4_9ROSI|nr:PC-Esterase [Corchorus olitorius]
MHTKLPLGQYVLFQAPKEAIKLDLPAEVPTANVCEGDQVSLGGDWNSGGSCNGETEPVLKGAILDNYPLKMKIVEEVIQEMKVPVILLNVTRLTNFRKDGHPSIYGKRLTEGKKPSARRQDCSHWCLPGVPDAWNELIYATLFFNKQF